ncbi:hypothetical protein BDF19DRAFT_439591 [Syncephalis fuscata]|nr:hypothetical protein BDF19DRAFT_439591 [Syncephalis fuscata]
MVTMNGTRKGAEADTEVSQRPKSRGISEFKSALEFIGKTKSNKRAVEKPEAALPVEPDTAAPSHAKANSISERVNNPFIDVIYKRLRTLKKRLARVEKYEDIVAKHTPEELSQHLNEDQRKAIAEKSGIEGAIRELEETRKQLLSIDVEETRSLKKKKQEQEQEMKKTVRSAVNNATIQGDKAIEAVVNYFYAVSQLLPQAVQNSTSAPSEADLIAIEMFKLHLFTSVANSSTNDDTTTTASIVRHLTEASDTTFNDNITFAQVQEVIVQLLQPLTATADKEADLTNDSHKATGAVSTEFTNQENTNAATALDQLDDTDQQNDDDDNDVPRQKVIPPGGFCFIHTSEIYDVVTEEAVATVKEIVDVEIVDEVVNGTASATLEPKVDKNKVKKYSENKRGVSSRPPRRGRRNQVEEEKKDELEPLVSSAETTGYRGRGRGRGGRGHRGGSYGGYRGGRGRGGYRDTSNVPTTTVTTPPPPQATVPPAVVNNEDGQRQEPGKFAHRGRGRGVPFRGHPRGGFRGGHGNHYNNNNTNNSNSKNNNLSKTKPVESQS